MIKIGHRETFNPQRQVFTSRQPRNHRKRIDLDETEHLEINDSELHHYMRPKTTALIRRANYSTINSSSRNSNMINLRSISAIQNELSDHFKQQMSPFLKNKFKTYVKKKHQQHVLHRYFNRTLQTTELQNTSKFSSKLQLDNYYTLINGQKLQVQREVDEVYLTTAKEKISRLIQMKKQKEIDYECLSNRIKAKRNLIDTIRKKNRFNEFKKLTIEEQEWDKSWIKDKNEEEKRYRNRLIMRCNKRSNPFFNIVN